MGIQEAKVLIRAKVPKINKEQTQQHRGYKYVSHEDVTEQVVPIMHEYGLTHTVSIDQNLELASGMFLIVAQISFQMVTGDEEPEIIRCPAIGKIVDGTSAGALVSYAVKVAFLKYFGIVTGEKDDMERLQGHDPSRHGDTPPDGFKNSEREREAVSAGNKLGVDDSEIPF
jgi:hypothetical protein